MGLEAIRHTIDLPLVIYFQGNFENFHTHIIIDIIESNEKSTDKKSQLKKLMFLSVEAIQNIQRYSEHLDNLKDSTLILCDNKYYQIYTSNLVKNDNIPELKKRLDELVSKTHDELNEIYIEKISSNEKTEKGAGLGLIEMARKSNNFQFEFNKIDETYSTFNLCLCIPLNKKEEEPADFNKIGLIFNAIHKMFTPSNSAFYFGGDFSNNFILSLLEFLLSKQAEVKKNADKKIHHVLIELIQNIRRHAILREKKSNGKLIIEWDEKAIEISTFNLSTKENSSKLNDKIKNLNNSNKGDLGRLSAEILSDLESNNGLGMVDIANVIFPQKIICSIEDFDQICSSVLLSVAINNE